MKKHDHAQIYHFIVEYHQTFGGHYAMFNVRHPKRAETKKVTATQRRNEEG